MLDLAAVKLHLRIDHASEDALLTNLMTAATDTVAHYIGATSLDDTAPAAVKLAATLLVGTMYEQRESVGKAKDNGMFEQLLEAYRVMV